MSTVVHVADLAAKARFSEQESVEASVSE